MTASMTPLPVLGVPVQTKAPRGPRQPLFHRADAGRHSGRHARHRRSRRDQRRAARRRRSSRSPTRTSPRASTAYRAAQTASVAEEPECANDRTSSRLDHRHSRRRPARPHAGARRRAVSASSATSIPTCQARPSTSRPRSTVAPYEDTTAIRAFAARGRRRHLRVRERAARSRGGGRGACARSSRPEGARGRAGPPRGKELHSRRSASRRALRRRRQRGDLRRPRVAHHRRRRHPEDAPPRLRRQGPGAHVAARRSSRPRSNASAARALRARGLRRRSRTRCRCSSCAAAHGEIALLRHPAQHAQGRHPRYVDRAVAAARR